MKVKIEQGKVTEGVHNLRDEFRNTKDGYYNLVLEKWSDSRSARQNRLFWKWMEIMGDHYGYTKVAMHDEMLDLFSPIYTTKDIKTGKPKQRRMGTSMMTVKQMYDFMQEIKFFALDENITLPEPDDDLVEEIKEKFNTVEEKT